MSSVLPLDRAYRVRSPSLANTVPIVARVTARKRFGCINRRMRYTGARRRLAPPGSRQKRKPVLTELARLTMAASMLSDTGRAPSSRIPASNLTRALTVRTERPPPVVQSPRPPPRRRPTRSPATPPRCTRPATGRRPSNRRTRQGVREHGLPLYSPERLRFLILSRRQRLSQTTGKHTRVGLVTVADFVLRLDVRAFTDATLRSPVSRV